MSAPGPADLPPLCGLCHHPVDWHPIPGSPSARCGLGCLECSCSFTTAEADEAARAAAERENRAQRALLASSASALERGVLDGRLRPEADLVPRETRALLDTSTGPRCEECAGACVVGLGTSRAVRWLCLACFDAALEAAEGRLRWLLHRGEVEVEDPAEERRRRRAQLALDDDLPRARPPESEAERRSRLALELECAALPAVLSLKPRGPRAS